ncbi:hypothetical protein M436DRAFT_78206 [Aureobasidium namibiae CBS 147.97]|uniref:Uncharacterized protein n=1 Tax=Aureobasidium namibiae CBS 147.97 TaxID=1043004 RepID=A0A074WTC1_9PEZI
MRQYIRCQPVLVIRPTNRAWAMNTSRRLRLGISTQATVAPGVGIPSDAPVNSPTGVGNVHPPVAHTNVRLPGPSVNVPGAADPIDFCGNRGLSTVVLSL